MGLLIRTTTTPACKHYRVLTPYGILRRRGIIDYQSSDDIIIRPSYAGYNYIWQRYLTEPEHLAGMEIIHHLLGKVFLEIDDDFMNLHPLNPAWDACNGVGKQERLRKILTQADGVIVSTRGLAEVYGVYNSNIAETHNGLDYTLWDKHIEFRRARKKNDGWIRIGYHGAGAHNLDMVAVREAIPEVIRRTKRVKFVSIGDDWGRKLGWKLPENRYEIRPWLSFEDFGKLLWDIDIAIAPLANIKFNLSKSNIKILENGALGIPTVATRIGEYSRTITDGVDGLLVENGTQNWTRAIMQLITDVKLLRRIGVNVEKTVCDKWDAEKLSLEWENGLRKIGVL